MSAADRDARLVGRANAVAAFFRAYPAAEGAAGVRDHIDAFWTPAMRDALRGRASAGDGAGLDPLVRAAFLDRPQAAAPGRPETDGPREAGAIGASDSG
ncbi:formate dehydrogenase subunit delta [Lichenibacterium dinghuense]|uniref:formate dehydrogenase subunit delta n=1 Tax=Lichenibacterium dinghuense TaxID=2895977 RepID=UPI001F3C7296|nr:formate dehydrogenase subunit delta [Lichenibacterium sp. 6Y81]